MNENQEEQEARRIAEKNIATLSDSQRARFGKTKDDLLADVVKMRLKMVSVKTTTGYANPCIDFQVPIAAEGFSS